MLVKVQVTINGSRAAIWVAMTSIENAAEFISGIEKIDVLENRQFVDQELALVYFGCATRSRVMP